VGRVCQVVDEFCSVKSYFALQQLGANLLPVRRPFTSLELPR
jgi:hypothetical protein